MPVLTTGDPNNLLTYTSPSTKWVRNASGIYVSGTTLRCDHLADGTALGLLVEGQRTRDTTHPCNFGDAAWSKTDITVTDNATAAPDGTTTADLITEGTAGTAAIQQGVTKTTASLAVSGSIFVKPSANNTWLQVVLGSSGLTDGVNAWVNLSTGALGTVSARGSATLTGAAIEAAANGFYRVYLWATFGAGAADHTMYVRSASADNSSTRVNSSAYYLWQAQVELGARPSSPIDPATNTAVTRAADDIYILLSQLPFSATVGTLIARVRTPFAIGNQTLVNIGDNTTNERFTIRDNTAGIAGLIVDGGVTQASMVSGLLGVDAIKVCGMAWAANDAVFQTYGSSKATDASLTLPTVDRFHLGSLPTTSNYLEGWIQKVIYLPRRMSDTDLSAKLTELAA